MVTKQKTPSQEEIQDSVRGFSMALRETIMDYYKGTCVQGFSLLSNYNIRVDRIPLENDGTRRNFNYEREDWAQRNPLTVQFSGSKIFELWKDEHEVIFHPAVLRRSEALSIAYDQLVDFFNKYLPSVTMIEKDTEETKRHTNGENDLRHIINGNQSSTTVQQKVYNLIYNSRNLEWSSDDGVFNFISPDLRSITEFFE